MPVLTCKISKPLMEKKRRARINVSLEQLKALLEKHYSHHVSPPPREPRPQMIRKRKLEKADILELSVKYMKSLQNSVQGADYQAGFRSCLHGVNQFLLRSEGASEASSFQLLQELARASPRVSGSGCRTTDSSPTAPRPEPRGSRPGGRAAEPRAPLQKAGGSRPFTQRPGAPGAPSSQPPTEPGAAAQRRGAVEQRPSLPGRSQALWRPW
ncbi:transcription factor HES-3 isoform X2 [Caretta caretta]|uniref:transcription factor HES-3 isoform X2 n=1 Tax=Caretta caretta TaxID=8467 RepID=UPI002095E60B|nr:transcription factor HES-3 isoform X2 [Caretta caretta]